MTFTARADGDVYILVGYKFPIVVDIRYPGQASYTFTCTTSAPTLVPAPIASGGGAVWNATPQATPLAIACSHVHPATHSNLGGSPDAVDLHSDRLRQEQ